MDKPPPLPRTFADRIRGPNLRLLRGTDDTGRKAWYFVLLDPHKVLKFESDCKIDDRGGRIHLMDYGQIVASGFGADPPPETQNQMKEKYGFEE